MNVASVVGLRGVEYMSAYGAAKAGLINFSRASAVEGAPHESKLYNPWCS